MYVATFQVTSDVELALLRIDISSDGATATYQLQDAIGDCHEWNVSLSNDTTSRTFIERAAFSLVTYLYSCETNGWTGTYRVVQSGIGIPLDYWEEVQRAYTTSVGFARVTKPEGVALQ